MPRNLSTTSESISLQVGSYTHRLSSLVAIGDNIVLTIGTKVNVVGSKRVHSHHQDLQEGKEDEYIMYDNLR